MSSDILLVSATLYYLSAHENELMLTYDLSN